MSAEILTEKEIAEIEARLAAATPGPWTLWEGHAQVYAGVAEQDDGQISGFPHEPMPEICRCEDDELDASDAENNADLIANAPTDIARLLAEVKRLRERAAIVEQTDKEIFAGWEERKIEHAEEVSKWRSNFETMQRLYHTAKAEVREACAKEADKVSAYYADIAATFGGGHNAQKRDAAELVARKIRLLFPEVDHG